MYDILFDFHQFMFAGHYKVEIFDKAQNQYLPTVAGLGMHVEVKDPDEKIVLSRVRNAQSALVLPSHDIVVLLLLCMLKLSCPIWWPLRWNVCSNSIHRNNSSQISLT